MQTQTLQPWLGRERERSTGATTQLTRSRPVLFRLLFVRPPVFKRVTNDDDEVEYD